MRLEITCSQHILREKFVNKPPHSIEILNLLKRLENHILVYSNELLKLWEADATSLGYKSLFNLTFRPLRTE